MLPSAQQHIADIEAKASADRKAKQDQAEGEIQIKHMHRIIAEAERRKVAPVFASDDALTTFDMMKGRVEKLAEDYERGLLHALQGGRPYPLDLASEGAIAFFGFDVILGKLPGLADRISSRSGLGSGINETKRAAVVAECDAMIADAKAKLAVFTGQG